MTQMLTPKVGKHSKGEVQHTFLGFALRGGSVKDTHTHTMKRKRPPSAHREERDGFVVVVPC